MNKILILAYNIQKGDETMKRIQVFIEVVLFIIDKFLFYNSDSQSYKKKNEYKIRKMY